MMGFVCEEGRQAREAGKGLDTIVSGMWVNSEMY